MSDKEQYRKRRLAQIRAKKDPNKAIKLIAFVVSWVFILMAIDAHYGGYPFIYPVMLTVLGWVVTVWASRLRNK